MRKRRQRRLLLVGDLAALVRPHLTSSHTARSGVSSGESKRRKKTPTNPNQRLSCAVVRPRVNFLAISIIIPPFAETTPRTHTHTHTHTLPTGFAHEFAFNLIHTLCALIKLVTGTVHAYGAVEFASPSPHHLLRGAALRQNREFCEVQFLVLIDN